MLNTGTNIKSITQTQGHVRSSSQALPYFLTNVNFSVCEAAVTCKAKYLINLKRICYRSVKLSTAVGDHTKRQKTFIKMRFDKKKN